MDNLLFAGVDVGKTYLDVSFLRHHRRFQNNPSGIRLLRDFVGDAILVSEASGGYERLLATSGLPVAVVSPARVRHYARAMGFSAKTDRIDARLIADFAVATKPVPKSHADSRLDHLCRLHRVLIKQQLLLRQAEEHDVFTELAEVKSAVDLRLKAVLSEVEHLVKASQKGSLLLSVPGVGIKTAAVLLSQLPELGSGDAEGLSSLVGVAPFARESGAWQGKRFISGGRFEVRRALYMAAVSAVRCNPVVAQSYKRLREKGKPAKVALVASMRKLLLILHSVVKNNRPFSSLLP